MKTVAAIAAVTTLLLSACTVEPASRVVTETEGSAAPVREEVQHAQDEAPVMELAAVPQRAPEREEVRDAKEAAEDAAKRIFSAASRLKEVGIGAVKSVREDPEAANEAPDAAASEPLADAALHADTSEASEASDSPSVSAQ